MKNISLILNVVLLIAVGILYYLHFSSKQNTVPKHEASHKSVQMPKVELKGTPIVYVNVDSLWDKYELVKQMRKELESQRNIFEKKFEADYHKLESDYLDLRDKAATLTQEEGMARQQDLMLREQKLTEYRQNELERLAKLEADKSDKIQNDISTYLNEQYRKTNYSYILGYSTGGGILFANDSLEITKEVIDGLNANIKK
ncbi:MAG: OmpH family outer membrane protein [Bacteroidia bacterium]|nr:OmpH family outer membrane protein [Bacteroidia bacterium]MCZ2249774.1 OmpH family outer membrane protein [Bacteroidia bacterium]